MTNILHTPNFKFNLLSANQLTKQLNNKLIFTPIKYILQTLSINKPVTLNKKKNNLYLTAPHSSRKSNSYTELLNKTPNSTLQFSSVNTLTYSISVNT